jgi:hypothetical protein
VHFSGGRQRAASSFVQRFLVGDVQMNAIAKKNANAGEDGQFTFDVQVCSKDGRLISEYTLTRRDNNVSTIRAAESCACKNLSDYHEQSLVVVVSETTLTKLRQVQTDCRIEKSKLDKT